jgi:hypothetical protein
MRSVVNSKLCLERLARNKTSSLLRTYITKNTKCCKYALLSQGLPGTNSLAYWDHKIRRIQNVVDFLRLSSTLKRFGISTKFFKFWAQKSFIARGQNEKVLGTNGFSSWKQRKGRRWLVLEKKSHLQSFSSWVLALKTVSQPTVRKSTAVKTITYKLTVKTDARTYNFSLIVKTENSGPTVNTHTSSTTVKTDISSSTIKRDTSGWVNC